MGLAYVVYLSRSLYKKKDFTEIRHFIHTGHTLL